MAVYKATYCYPFLGSCDLRVAAGETQWITCKVDSSNKKVTGYRISIYDENNKLIFPYWNENDSLQMYHKRDWNISPLSELLFQGRLLRNDKGDLVMREEDGETDISLPSQEYLTNSGLNGSYLNLPFFQNDSKRVLTSANAVYYLPKFRAEYYIGALGENDPDYFTPNNASFWAIHDDGNYYYNKDASGQVVDADAGVFSGRLNGDYQVRPFDTVLMVSSSTNIIVGHLYYKNDSWCIVPDEAMKNDLAENGNSYCVITRGSHHDEVYCINKNGVSEFTGALWHDAAGKTIEFSVGKSYKWEITLYQGDGKIVSYSGKIGKLVDYSGIDVSEWYDMVLQSGQILGSCPARVQLAKYDEKNAEYLLPKNKDGSSVILYKTYAQLINTDGKEMGARFYVNNYSSSLGHVYPLESDASVITVEGATAIEFFKHSNNPEAILDTDMVEMASVADHVYGVGREAGDVELCGLQNIDGVVGEDGKYVLLMHQKKPAENGVYKMVGDSDNKITVKVSVTITDDKGTKTTSSQAKEFTRDSSKDIYQSGTGIPEKFAWVHEKTENESKMDFNLVFYSSARYLAKGDAVQLWDANQNLVTASITNVKMAIWSRAGGYTSWSDFIGKIIYVRNGETNGQKNFSSTATAGGTLMKKPYNQQTTPGASVDGSSPLYFVPERSVVLFPQLLNDDYSIKAMGEFSAGKDSDTVDGVILSTGDYYIEQSSGCIYNYSTLGNAGNLVRSPDSEVKYYYINQGQTNGLQVCKISTSEVDPDSKDLNRAEVLKNTNTRTFIGQYVNLDTDMVLKFDSKVVKFSDGSAPQNYLNIKKVNKIVWYVEHERLKAPFRSYSNNQDEPYYYKICTFYKKSDENPFYFRETPYLIINSGLNDGYTKDDDYRILYAYPTADENSKILADYPVDYELYRDKIFLGTPEEGLQQISYVEAAVGKEDPGDGVTVRKDDISFAFPELSVSSGAFVWSDKKTTFNFEFEKAKISDDNAITTLAKAIENTYENSERKALGGGAIGLKSIKMPGVLIEAAATKYVSDSSKEKVNYLVLDNSPSSESGYKLSLNGQYKQGNGGSWESYRWVLEKVKFDGTLTSDQISSLVKTGDPSLFDHMTGAITIKDTGNKYDKNMSVEFYGLLDNIEDKREGDDIIGVEGDSFFSNIYLITLYVTDENGRDSIERRFIEYKAPNKEFSYCISNFSASMNCQNECVELCVSPRFLSKDGTFSGDIDFDYLRKFSIFRREYKRLYRYDEHHVKQKKILIGNKWEPVVLDLNVSSADSVIKMLDFNIKSGYSYQYVIFPGNYSSQMMKVPYIYANTEKAEGSFSQKRLIDDGKHWRDYYSYYSRPVRPVLQYWSIINLIPTSESTTMGTDIDSYVVDPDNIWLFKYQVESGSLTQNISKNEFSTLGKYSKVGIGRKNYISGSVSCYLGSEIVPLSRSEYIERTPAARLSPVSTNEKSYMVEKWREFVVSGTPKLLRDTKGQSWIVQVMDGSTTTNEAIFIKPDTINFSWKQIADVTDATIYADAKQVPTNEGCLGEWQEAMDYE